jgi:uncharacterized repeat protein (TIGR03803 family)
MRKESPEVVAHLSAPVAGLTRIGLRGALLSALAVAGLADAPARAATMPQSPPGPAAAPGRETVLYTFTGGSADGAEPSGGVVRDSAGNLYGTTYWGGGTGCNYGYGCGIVFRIDTSGTETILYRFSGGSDGGIPNGGLIRDSKGNLYGTTSFGGDTAACGAFGYTGCGVVFRLDKSGNETVLYTFTGRKDGGWPVHEKLLVDGAGGFYGTAEIGGDLNCSPTQGLGCGVVFRLDADGTYTVLHAFKGNAEDGYAPVSGVVQDARGNLYGETPYGGADGQGTVYRLTANGKETVIHEFTGGADGGYPTGGELAIDAGGRLFGTASQGGNLSACGGAGCGVVFTMSRRGTEEVLYAFQNGLDGSTDGAYPREGVVRDAGGRIFGMTQGGGAAGFGMVFELSKSTSGNFVESVLLDFTDGADGAYPSGENLIIGPKGTLYGVTERGGDDNCLQGKPEGCGVVFKLKP